MCFGSMTEAFMPDSARWIGGLMKSGSVLPAISDRYGKRIMPMEPLFCFTSNRLEIHPCQNCRAPMTLISDNPFHPIPTYAPSVVSTATVLTRVWFIEAAHPSDLPERQCRGE
jgi:hypothetical protein